MNPIRDVAVQQIQKDCGISASFVSDYEVHEVQLNADGSMTHDVSLTIDNIKYDVEVYEKDGIYTADCWQVDGDLRDKLRLV